MSTSAESKVIMLIGFLTQEKTAIVEAWVRLIISSYPAQSSRFLIDESDQFSNPVGHTIITEAKTIFEYLLTNADNSQLAASLDNIIRIRTVQDFSAAQAVGFVFSLKDAIHAVMSEKKYDNISITELMEFESRIDKLALLAFDSYMQCRDRINEIRVNEIKRKSHFLFERLNMNSESLWQEGQIDNDSHSVD